MDVSFFSPVLRAGLHTSIYRIKLKGFSWLFFFFSLFFFFAGSSHFCCCESLKIEPWREFIPPADRDIPGSFVGISRLQPIRFKTEADVMSEDL